MLNPSHIFAIKVLKPHSSLKNGKKAKVTPLHKGGPKDDLNNYRPISILPVMSKFLEKHIHDLLMTYLVKFNLLHKNQSGLDPAIHVKQHL